MRNNRFFFQFLFAAILIIFFQSVALAMTLSHFGAVGDGKTDDTLAIKKAIASHASLLDGEGKTYRVIGTLQVNKDIKIQNVRFLQGEQVVTSDLMKESHPRFKEKLYSRTLWIRSLKPSVKLKIVLENIYIHKGIDETQGLPSDSAGIWLDGVTGSLQNVEITGHGSGMGIMIVNSSKILLDQIHIHDMIWRPWESKPQLNYDEVSHNWNGIQSWELSKKGEESVKGLFFSWQRIQEKISGIMVVKSDDITIQNSSIDRLLARFKTGRLEAYQTDGITIGSYTKNIHLENVWVTHAWEGVDLTGSPLMNATVKNSQVMDAHAFGFKMANGARNVTLENNHAIRCGLSGFVVSGKSNFAHTARASGNIVFNHCIAENTGSNGYWVSQATIAGFRIMTGRIESPSNVKIQNCKAIDNKVFKTMKFGFHTEAKGNPANSISNVISLGHIEKASGGF